MTLQRRFWLMSLGFVLLSLSLLLVTVSLFVTPPVVERLVRLEEENRLYRFGGAAGMIVPTPAVAPSQISIPLDERYSLVSQRPLRLGEALKVVQPSLRRVFLSLVLWMSLLYLLTTLLARRVVRPLRDLVKGVTALSSGRRGVTVNVPRERELAQLAESFNRMSRELARREEELEAAVRSKELMFAATGHELRTPLTVILGFCQMLQDGLRGELSESQLASVEVIARNARSLLGQVETLLLNAQIQGGTLTIRWEKLDLREIASEIVTDLTPLARQRGLRLVLEPSPEACLVQADRDHSRRIVRNLVENGLKFTSQGEVHVSFYPDSEAVLLRVRDSGPGVHTAFHDKLFQDYSRGPNSEGIEGTGLGLALSQRLARQMGGDLQLLDGIEPGATFEWRHPRCVS